jgi:TPP-dependent pyruvate/acetoin dehydrogenase alpha subunit
VLIRLIYEDEQLEAIKEQIKQLESNQLYFLEEFIRKEKKNRKQRIFEEWKETLEATLEEEIQGRSE